MKYVCAIIMLMLANPELTFPQDTLMLTLEKSLSLALQQGYAIQNASEQYLSSKRNYEAQELSSATTVDLNLKVPDYSESLTNQFNPLTQRYEFYQLQSTLLRSTLSVNQPVTFTGGTVSLSGDFFQRNQLSGTSGTSQTINDYFSYFQVSVRQPILTPNVQSITVNRASLELNRASSDYIRHQLDIIYEVTNAFYTAYRLSRQEQISREQVEQNEDSYATARSKYVSGLIPEVEMLQTEVDLVTSRNQQLNDQREASQAKNALKLLIGLPLEGEISLTSELKYTPVEIDLKTAIEKALLNRLELLSAKQSLELSAMDIELASSRRHLRLDLTASYGLNRNDTQLESVLRDFGRTRNIALEVTVPIFDWGRHAREVETAEAQYKSAELTYANTGQQIRQEIIDLVSRVRVAESRIQVLVKSIEVAQKSYEISLERFRVGTITRNDLAQAQQRLTNSKLNSLIALIDYRTGLADLTRKTLWDFEKNEPVSVEPPHE